MAVGSKKAHLLFHRRKARRLSESRPRARGDVPNAHRVETDRRSRRSQTARRHRPMRTAILLELLVARAPSGEPRRCQGSASLAESVADLRGLRPTDVLPALRARVLCPAAKALPEGRKAGSDAPRRGEGCRQRYLP